MILFLKGLVSIVNFLVLLLATAGILYKFKKRKTALTVFYIFVLVFLLTSTNYLPNYLAYRLEAQYAPLTTEQIKNIKGKIYLHVLGSGYNKDSRLPPNAQLGMVGLARLSEAIRIFRLTDSAIIVCSASSVDSSAISQAEVVRNTAVVLGIPAARTLLLTTPTTTFEEAQALSEVIDKQAQVAIVTDALHMPRAMHFFKENGFTNLIAAPARYKTYTDHADEIRWWPSFDNIGLMDEVLHEYLGNLKAWIKGEI